MKTKKALWGLLLFAASTILPWGCRFGASQPEDWLLVPDEQAYFPVELGRYTVYKASRIKFNSDEVHDTSAFWLKEIVVDTFRLSSGEKAYRLETFKKEALDNAWTPDSVRVLTYRNNTWVKMENNMWFVKLAFPFQKGKEWNRNAYNTQPKEESVLQNIQKPLQTHGLDFPATVTVATGIDTLAAIIQWKECYDIYAKDNGLVFKECKKYLFFNNGDPTHPKYGKGIITGGSYEKLVFVESGKE
jgi:hypothetical protein